MTRRGDSDAGFSLVEALVSLAVIASMSALLFDTISADARIAQQAEKRRRAVLLAQSLLAAAEAPADPASTARSGTVDGMGWTISRRGWGGAGERGIPLEALRIVVTDQASGRILTSVDTLRLAR